MEQRIRDSLELDHSTGKVYWKNASKFHIEKQGLEAGGVIDNRGDKRWVISLDGKKYKRSRIVYFLANGTMPVGVVDHINRNSLDDRPGNLRDTDIVTNNHNHSRRNIRFVKPTGRYQVRLGRQFSRHVDTMQEAVNLYDRKRAELWKT